MSDVMVVGGGAVGLLSALELSDRGCSVTVLDAPQARPPASWAGGGILSALFPWRYPDGVSALTRNALAAYQVLAQRFREHGLPELEVVECGLLMPGASDMDSAPAWAAAHEMSGVLTTAGEIVPQLGDEPAFWMPGVGHIRNPDLLKGVRALLRQRDVRFEMARVQSVKPERARWQVRTTQSTVTADRVLISAGAWSTALLETLGLTLPMMPVKGEMLRFPASVPAPPCIVLREEGYVIPRQDGSMLVGSTMLAGCDDQRPSSAAYEQLVDVAARIWAPLADVTPVAHWAGLRPGSDHPVPWLSEVPGYDGLFVATGHYRNGLVCAPASATIMASLITRQTLPIDPAPYSLSFSSSSPP